MSPIALVLMVRYMVNRLKWMRRLEERSRDVELGVLEGESGDGVEDLVEEQVEERGRTRTKV